MPPPVIWPLVLTADMDRPVMKVTILLRVMISNPSTRPVVRWGIPWKTLNLIFCLHLKNPTSDIPLLSKCVICGTIFHDTKHWWKLVKNVCRENKTWTVIIALSLVMMWHTHWRTTTLTPSRLCHGWVECGHPTEWSQLAWVLPGYQTSCVFHALAY